MNNLGPSKGELLILQQLAKVPKATGKELLGMTPELKLGSCYTMLARLREKGLVVIAYQGFGREHHYQITARGQLLQEARTVYEAAVARFYGKEAS